MKQFHTKGRENSGNCACFPPLLGERAGVRASVSANPIFGGGGSFFKIRNPKSEIDRSLLTSAATVQGFNARNFSEKSHSTPLPSEGERVPGGVCAAIGESDLWPSIECAKSMPEMAHTREDHRYLALVRGGDDFGVTDRTTRLNRRGR